MRFNLFILACSLLAASATAGAELLYRWIDENGGAQFSDQPPPAGARNVTRFEGPDYVDNGLPGDQYSISNQLQRLEASKAKVMREQREQQRIQQDFELRQRELEARAQERQRTTRDTPVYAYPRVVQPQRPGRDIGLQPHRPRGLWDDHPAYWPGPRPLAPAPPGGYVVAPR